MSSWILRHVFVMVVGLIPIIVKVIVNSDLKTDKLGNASYVLSLEGFRLYTIAGIAAFLLCLVVAHFHYIEELLASKLQKRNPAVDTTPAEVYE